jgi:hypothetical protein
MKKWTKTIECLLFVFMAFLISCVESEDYETVRGTDIPVSELWKSEGITEGAFKTATEGKYYALCAYYCQRKGTSLRYLQTGENYYGIEGYLKDVRDGSGDFYIQFDDSIMHYYNDLFMWDRRYIFTYDEKALKIPTIVVNGVSDSKLHTCELLYVDDKNIIARTAVYRPHIQSLEARQAAAKADFVLLRFAARIPPEYFKGYTDWDVSYLSY